MQDHHPTKELNGEIIWKKVCLQKKKQWESNWNLRTAIPTRHVVSQLDLDDWILELFECEIWFSRVIIIFLLFYYRIA